MIPKTAVHSTVFHDVRILVVDKVVKALRRTGNEKFIENFRQEVMHSDPDHLFEIVQSYVHLD